MLFQINEIMATLPYSLHKKEKSDLFNEALRSLTDHHYRHCSKYKSILDALKFHQGSSYQSLIAFQFSNYYCYSNS